MAELTHKERLQPSLLDRLTDDEPEKQLESRNQRVLSPARLRESVRRDLVWLFNTTNFAALVPGIAKLPAVAKSVVNFGLPDLAGHTASSLDVAGLEQLIRDAIWDFEPRLLKTSIKVSVDEEEMNHNAVKIAIEALLWAQPIPLRLFLKTEVDLETGHVSIDEMRSE